MHKSRFSLIKCIFSRVKSVGVNAHYEWFFLSFDKGEIFQLSRLILIRTTQRLLAFTFIYDDIAPQPQSLSLLLIWCAWC